MTVKCSRSGCPVSLTWAEQRRQFGRAVRAGLSVDEIKALMPRCQKCMTEELSSRPASDWHSSLFSYRS